MERCSSGSLEEHRALLDVGPPHSDGDSDGDSDGCECEWEEHEAPQDLLYSRCLARTLCDAAAPLTVGIFAPCPHRLQGMLQHLEASMHSHSALLQRRSARSGRPPPRTARGWGLLQALFLLTLFRPVLRRPARDPRRPPPNISFIFVRFSAWHYVGCDRLWAGLISALCRSVRRRFGPWPLAVFHVAGAAPRHGGPGGREWELRTAACVKAGAIVGLLLLGSALLLLALAAPWLREHRVLGAVGVALSSASGSGLLAALLAVLRRVAVSERSRVERWSDREKFEAQLGFMSKVRAEVEGLSAFIAAMEVFERRRLRVVMEISALERCGAERCAGVLEAVNTLLADPEAPFISVLAMEPGVVVQCLEGSAALRGVGGNAYVYLRRTVGVPFWVPSMEHRQRMREVRRALGGGHPADRNGHPGWSDGHPVQREEHPVHLKGNPVDHKERPGRGNGHPMQREEHLHHEEHLLSQEQHPLQLEEHPVQSSGHPVRDEEHPQQEEHPVNHEQHPLHHGGHPLPYEEHPLPHEEHPSPHEKHPSLHEEHPHHEEHPVPHEEHPSPYEEHPLPHVEHPHHEKHPSPYEEHPHHKEHSLPYKEHPSPYEEHPLPHVEHPHHGEHPSPYEEHPLPCEEHPSHHKEHPVPCKEHPSPYEEHPVPHAEHPAPHEEHPWVRVAERQTRRCVRAALRSLHDPQGALCRFVPSDGAQLRRILSIVPITVRLLLHRCAPHGRGGAGGAEEICGAGGGAVIPHGMDSCGAGRCGAEEIYGMEGCGVMPHGMESCGAGRCGVGGCGVEEIYGVETGGMEPHGMESCGVEEICGAERHRTEPSGTKRHGMEPRGAEMDGTESRVTKICGAEEPYGVKSSGAEIYGAESHWMEPYGAEICGAEELYGVEIQGTEPHRTESYGVEPDRIEPYDVAPHCLLPHSPTTPGCPPHSLPPDTSTPHNPSLHNPTPPNLTLPALPPPNPAPDSPPVLVLSPYIPSPHKPTPPKLPPHNPT
uniref:KAP NTPase domain-containing protein n=2 Tax=Phasianus colchicus TaxID=9054 RepID=A0A669QEJ3_PHACC